MTDEQAITVYLVDGYSVKRVAYDIFIEKGILFLNSQRNSNVRFNLEHVKYWEVEPYKGRS